jgi:anti-sigma-K factor RskA
LVVLENEDKIHFQAPESEAKSYFGFISSKRAMWYWMTVAFTALTVVVVLLVPSNEFW